MSRAKLKVRQETMWDHYYRTLDGIFADRRSLLQMRHFEHLKRRTGVSVVTFMVSRIYEWQQRNSNDINAVY